MPRRPSRTLVVAFLIAIAWLSHPGAATAQLFSEQAVAQNVTFSHHVDLADEIDMGAGGAFGDFDGDGDPDLYVADRIGANKLFENQGLGTGFVEVGVACGVDLPTAESTGALFGDYDNDGDQDLYVMNRGDNVLFRNDGSDGLGGWIFTDVTASLGVEAFGRTSSACYGDYDNDGYLDLYVGNHVYSTAGPTPGDLYHSDFLFHNVPGPDGSRSFEDVTAQVLNATLLSISIAHSVGFVDYDRDGDQDIYVVNEAMNHRDPALTGENLMFRNDGPDGQGNWIFTEVAGPLGLDHRNNPMGLAISDVDHDGWMDLAMSDLGANTLYMNQGGTSFVDVAPQAGIDRPDVPGTGTVQIGWGLVLFDYNFDAQDDLYVATGNLEVPTGQPNPFFQNLGTTPLTFADLTDTCGANPDSRSRTVVRADYDRDGDEDLYVVALGQKAQLFRNDLSAGDFVAIRLEGTVSNRDALGAIVRVTAPTLPDQYRMMQSGSTTGGGHEKRLTFGVPGVASVDVHVLWPSGQQTLRTGVTPASFLKIREPRPIPGLGYTNAVDLTGATPPLKPEVDTDGDIVIDVPPPGSSITHATLVVEHASPSGGPSGNSGSTVPQIRWVPIGPAGRMVRLGTDTASTWRLQWIGMGPDGAWQTGPTLRVEKH